MSNVDDAQQALGELFIVGFEGKELSDDTSAFLSQAGIGGVIIFEPNYQDPRQLAELINSVQDCRGKLPLWVSVDQEGGRVQRFKEPFTRLPPAVNITNATSPRTAFDVAQVCAKELKAVGINLNFAPCADILTNTESDCIGDRAFGSNPDVVTRMVTATVRGHVTSKVQPCVKHWPGHGDIGLDSHDELPRINTPVSELEKREFRPFVKTFKSRCNMVMVAHILNEAIDPDYPATLSKKTLQDVLRKDQRYSRIIISDDMEMQAITKHYGPEDAIRLAINAGCDLIIYKTEKAARHAYQSALKALENGEISPDRVIESAERLRELKKEQLLPYEAVSAANLESQIGTDEHREIIEKVSQ